MVTADVSVAADTFHMMATLPVFWDTLICVGGWGHRTVPPSLYCKARSARCLARIKPEMARKSQGSNKFLVLRKTDRENITEGIDDGPYGDVEWRRRQ